MESATSIIPKTVNYQKDQKDQKVKREPEEKPSFLQTKFKVISDNKLACFGSAVAVFVAAYFFSSEKSSLKNSQPISENSQLRVHYKCGGSTAAWSIGEPIWTCTWTNEKDFLKKAHFCKDWICLDEEFLNSNFSTQNQLSKTSIVSQITGIDFVRSSIFKSFLSSAKNLTGSSFTEPLNKVWDCMNSFFNASSSLIGSLNTNEDFLNFHLANPSSFSTLSSCFQDTEGFNKTRVYLNSMISAYTEFNNENYDAALELLKVLKNNDKEFVVIQNDSTANIYVGNKFVDSFLEIPVKKLIAQEKFTSVINFIKEISSTSDRDKHYSTVSKKLIDLNEFDRAVEIIEDVSYLSTKDELYSKLIEKLISLKEFDHAHAAELIEKVTYLSTKDELYSKLIEKLICLKEFDYAHAAELIEKVTYLSTEDKLYSKLIEKLISLKEFDHAAELIEKVTYPSKKLIDLNGFDRAVEIIEDVSFLSTKDELYSKLIEKLISLKEFDRAVEIIEKVTYPSKDELYSKLAEQQGLYKAH